MRHIRLFLAAIAVSAAVACSGKTLDIGAAASKVVDGGSSAFAGLTLDEEPCSVGAEGAISTASEWPVYRFSIEATCGSHGRVELLVDSRADLPYPRTCGAATQVMAQIADESDAGVLSFAADGTHGDCTITMGPSPSAPKARIDLVATIADNAGRRHRVRYATGGAGAGALPSDAVDASFENRPARKGRPVAVACTGPRPRPAGNVVDRDAGGDCTRDDTCVAHPEGRCNTFDTPYEGPGAAYCSYDACTEDADCAPGVVCGCGVGTAGNNVCLVQGNCRVDGDCSGGHVCAFSRPDFMLGPHGAAIVDGTEESAGVNIGREALGYFCTTPADDCPNGTPPGTGSGHCVFRPDRGHWSWAFGP